MTGPALVLRACASGAIRAMGDRRLVMLLFGTTIFAAIVPGMLMFSLIEARTSSAGQPATSLDFLRYSEIVAASPDTFALLARLEWTAAFFYLAVMLLASGGIIERAASPQNRFDVSAFLAGCVRWLRQIAGLFCAALVPYAVLMYVHSQLTTFVDATTSAWESERAVVLVELATHATGLLLLFAIAMVFRYARIILVLEGRTVASSIRGGIVFVGRRLFAATTVQIVPVALGGALLTAFSVVLNALEPASAWSIALWVCVIQGIVLLRVALRLAAVDAEVALWQALRTSGTGHTSLS